MPPARRIFNVQLLLAFERLSSASAPTSTASRAALKGDAIKHAVFVQSLPRIDQFAVQIITGENMSVALLPSRPEFYRDDSPKT